MAMLYLRNKPIGAISDGSSGGGHTIENVSGTDLTQRDTLQFSGYLQATDDSTSEKSIVSDAPNEVEYSVWQTMTDAQKEGKKWIIKNVPKTGGTPTDNSVSVIADGVKTASALFSELYALIDFTKITRNSVVSIYDASANATYNLRLSRKDPNDKLLFHGIINADATNAHDLILILDSSNVVYEYYALSSSSPNVSFASFTNFVYPSGATFTLYYNLIASPGVGDITADDVSYESGTVADALDGLGTWATQTVSMTGFLTGTATLYVNEKTRQCVLASTSVTTVSSSANSFWAIVARIPSAYIPKYGVVGTLDLTSSDGALFISSMPIHKNNVNDIVASCVPSSISAGLNADFSISWVY